MTYLNDQLVQELLLNHVEHNILYISRPIIMLGTLST